MNKLLVVVDCVPGVISVEAGKLKCFIYHSSTCSHCNYLSSTCSHCNYMSSFDRLDPATPACTAEMFDNNRPAKVILSTAVSYKRISYEDEQEYQLTLTKDPQEYIESCQDLPKLILRTAAGSTCVCGKQTVTVNSGIFKEIKLFTKTKVYNCHGK